MSESTPDKPDTTSASATELDLIQIEHELDAVESALERLDRGDYWTDEVTGETIPDAVLTDNPLARRAR